MNDNPERVQEFKSAIADLKLRDPSTEGERRWLVVGIVLMAAAIVVAVILYFTSTDTATVEDQNELIQLGLASIVVALVGIALFLRYSFGRLLRFWLVRIVYEMRAVSDASRDDEPTRVA